MKIESPLFSQFPDLKHGFFAPSPAMLTSERDKTMEKMAGRSLPLVTLKQVHGTKVIHVTQPLNQETEGDGLVTQVKGVALGILTADCGPVLFYDPFAGVIGACHAGWVGAKDGIIQETLRAMESLGGKRAQIYAALGPTVQQMSYEVGPEFPEFFQDYDTYFLPAKKEGHHYFNLPRYILDQLLKGGVEHIDDIRQNTFTGNFASRRRLLSQGLDKIGCSNLSAIAIV